MGSQPIDPHELLKGLDCFLGRDGEVKAMEGMAKIFNLMKESRKLVSRCIYLNIVLQTHSPDTLSKFIRVGGYKLLNNWLTYARTSNNSPLLHQILLTLQHLPLTVNHLKQNNTAKLVKQLSKGSDDAEVRKLACVLVGDWMAVIRSQSNIQPADKDKKKKKEDPKSRSPVPDKAPEVKAESRVEELADRKKEKPKIQRTTAPSHAKFRSTGLEVEAPSIAPIKKSPTIPVISDKYNLKPIPVKRQSSIPGPGDAPPAEKKYKPLNTTPNTTKEIKVKIIPPQPMESLGFLDALNSAPITGIKIKKKKKAVSPTNNKSSPFDSKSPGEPGSLTKPSSPEPESSVDGMDIERPGTPVPAVEIPEPMETSAPLSDPSDPKPIDADAPQLTKKGKKKKTVSWPDESHLREYFYFELDETERVNVNKVKDFGEAAKREMQMDRQAFQNARRISHDTMEESVPWGPPRPITLTGLLIHIGSNSTERRTQADREMGILQEIFLSKESVPDTPHEPDPEPYEPSPPKLIPLDEDSGMDEVGFPEPMDQGAVSLSPDLLLGAAKLPPVLANLMGSMGNTKTQPSALPGTMQEILTSIMGSQGNAKTEDLMKQPDFSDKIKQLLGTLQSQSQGPPLPVVPPGLLGPPPLGNGYPPPDPTNPPPLQQPPPMQPPPHYPPPGPPGPFPGPHGPPPGAPPGGPRMMGPPPPQRDGYWEPPPSENMRGGHHGDRGGMRGGGERGPPPPPFHRSRGGREPGYRGRGDRGPPGGGRNGPHGMEHDGEHRGHGGEHHRGHGGEHRGHGGEHRGHGGEHREHGGEHRDHGGEHRDHGGEHRGRGGEHRGRGGEHRGRGGDHRGHGGEYRGHGGEYRGHGHRSDRSDRPVCRHFIMKGNCRYENNCAFYHPGINGPHLL
ncbi:serine/threonine-protein phosphatase 1 regulatory subunit 10 isoform X2 [Ascaphus truei]|uniref:serine/threonine-protein phosphatase 1 regulatory subunit 10 isoform X2 n=1 Tax=Ascaphus truei TaxID=8439 RepID=UPI003F59FDB6